MRISACIIAKNEEKNLPRLLRSLVNKFDEIILVDTGSSDKTIEIAKAFGCKVFSHKWKGFADARNRAVKEAIGDWLWHFDADFELEEIEFKKALLAMKNAPKEIDAFSIGVKNYGLDGKVKAISSHIFIHRKGINWEGKVHECPKTNKIIGIPVFVNHYGYADPDLLFKKAKRNLELLFEEMSQLPKKSKQYNYKLFFVVQSYAILSIKKNSFIEKAKSYAEEFINDAKKEPENYGFFLVYMYNYYARILWQLKEFEKLERVINEFEKLGFKLPELFFFGYKLFRKKKDFDKSLEYLVKTTILLDAVFENPFSLPWGGASECLPLYEKEIMTVPPLKISSEKFKDLFSLWRKKPGRNLGLLLGWLSDEGKEKIFRKLAYRYPDDPLIHRLFLELLVKLGKRDEIEKLARLRSPVSKLYIAQLLELEGKWDEALKLFLAFLQENPNEFFIAYIFEKFPEVLKSLDCLTIMKYEELKNRDKEVGHGIED